MYKIVLTNRASKDIEKVDFKVKAHIGNKLTELMTNPIKISKKLSNSVIGTYRFRIGD